VGLNVLLLAWPKIEAIETSLNVRCPHRAWDALPHWVTVCACAIVCRQGFLKGLENLHCSSMEQILNSRDRFMAQLKVSFGQHPPNMLLSECISACCCGLVRSERAWVSWGKVHGRHGGLLGSARAARVLD